MLGIAIFSEQLTPLVVLGSSFILLAATLPHIQEMRDRRSKKPIQT
jgi:hypothetical protein